MAFHDLVDDGQPQAGPFSYLFGREEGIEDLRQQGRRDACNGLLAQGQFQTRDGLPSGVLDAGEVGIDPVALFPSWPSFVYGEASPILLTSNAASPPMV